MTESIFIIVLNWNNASDTIQCLESIKLGCAECQGIVVDNGSTDDSVEVVKSQFDVTVLETGENLGYAGGNNYAIKYALSAGADYVIILNNDVKVSPEFLKPLRDACIENPDVGIVTPLVLSTNGFQQVWSAGQAVDWKRGTVSRLFAGDSPKTVQGREPFKVDAASGAAMFVKRQVFEKVGLLDDQYFLYYEEVDWCLRAGRQGFKTMVVPESVVSHSVSSTLGLTSPVIDYYMLRNQLRFISLHSRGLARSWLLFKTCLRNLITVLAFSVKTHQGLRLPHRNARLLALRDAALGRWGKMGADVYAACHQKVT